MSDIDTDLSIMSTHELEAEVVRLRNGIREHRDAKGHDRCRRDDDTLYRLLPEQKLGDRRLPPKEEFLAECAKDCEQFWENRRHLETAHESSNVIED